MIEQLKILIMQEDHHYRSKVCSWLCGYFSPFVSCRLPSSAMNTSPQGFYFVFYLDIFLMRDRKGVDLKGGEVGRISEELERRNCNPNLLY